MYPGDEELLQSLWKHSLQSAAHHNAAETNGSVVPMRVIGDIQSMLLAIMCHIASICFSRKSFGVDDLDDKESRRQKCCFVDSAIAFFRLQHLNPNVLVKTQVCRSLTPV
ncbi:hypothetical protein OSB04_030108 [Centaurea solstitialis]|uniref:Uncharacterized protein n=1 Tax=Centaurea solstitialis TaxID=347529 RepID=A0AA38S6X8_9ASTR|nr:hypothetical protein OSB04_030108 [Centaurea solstitialis]